jgi:DNA-binding LacI/PurR family transcriptional regulator
LSVAGFDDLPGFPSGIPHTTIHVPHDEIGCMAATQLIEMIRNPEASAQQTQVPVHLVIRKSTGIASTLRQPA